MLMAQPPSSEHQMGYLWPLTYSLPFFVMWECPCHCLKRRASAVHTRPVFSGLPKVRVWPITLKSNSPFDQGLEAMVSTSILFTATTCTVTCPEVSHCVWGQFWLLQMSFCHWAELSVSLHIWSSEETTFCNVPCQSPAHTWHGLSTPRKHGLAS